ncbi:MAG: type II toxin-antitoxin system RelE/ParE family toxin [Thermomicrobiales bacterium]
MLGGGQRRTYAATLNAAFARLAEFPGIGRRRDELGPGLRSHTVGEHVIFYRVDDKAVHIRRVLHGRRDVRALTDI